MAIIVKFFASLRERLGRAETHIDADKISTVAEVWATVSNHQPMPKNLLMAVNREYADSGTKVQDGDEVAFFPPVTGGAGE